MIMWKKSRMESAPPIQSSPRASPARDAPSCEAGPRLGSASASIGQLAAREARSLTRHLAMDERPCGLCAYPLALLPAPSGQGVAVGGISRKSSRTLSTQLLAVYELTRT
jgi:hypothetical protein